MKDTTKEYSLLYPHVPFLQWPTGQTVSMAGFGTYRVKLGDISHAFSMMKAITSGINLIDTSTNYSLGASEELIGSVLKMVESQVKRSDLVIITKIGYLQGPLLNEAKQREVFGNPIPDMVKLSDDLYHCIHPEFLKEQLRLSLERMSTHYVDGLLLHNPEYFFKDPRLSKEVSLQDKRDLFYARIKMAFECMEEMVNKGLIKYYGISSNSFPFATDHPEFCSAERCLAIAKSIKKDHHFSVIQFPFNLVEPEAATELNQDDEGLTLIEFAEENNLVALVNRPLNGIRHGQIIRLSDANDVKLPNIEVLKNEIERISHAAFSFTENINLLGVEDEEIKNTLISYITAINSLQVTWNTYKSIDDWGKERDVILGKMAFSLTAINQLGNERVLDWVLEMAKLTTKIVNMIGSYYATLANADFKRNEYIRTVIEKAFPKGFTGIPLSQAAFNAMRSVSGISSVLIGARSTEYVDDVLLALKQPVPQYDRADWLGMKLH
jgi:aryl-alcohol dehydrogenase-like predicted oxidoreductase